MKLLTEAESNIGCAMTYTLIEWTKEHLEELLVDQPSSSDTCLSQVANLEIEDKVYLHTSHLLL